MNTSLIKRSGIVIVCGSGADKEHALNIKKTAMELGLDCVVRIASAHRTPEHALALIHQVDALSASFPVVLVTVAGRSNALSGFCDPQTKVPVIACPPPGSFENDIWSSVRMPAGVAPLFVMEPENAAIAAAKIIALTDKTVEEKVRAHQAKARQRVFDADSEMSNF